MDTNANQKVSCVANYTYEASETDELSLRPGDIVKDVERLPGGWWRGELRGRRGMFPDNFVSVIDQANARSGGVQGRCRAVFSYQPANADELPLCVGDVLDVLAEVEEGWWQGRRQGRVGVFPSNFVVMLDPPAPAPTYEPAPALPPKPVKELCRVLFPYTAVNDDEITLNEGDIVTIVSKDAPDRGWWRGELNGRVGLFPDNFVTLLPPGTQEIEEKKPERPPPAKGAPLYPVLNKYSEKTTSVKELTTSKISLHKENTVSKESNTASQLTHSAKSETEKVSSTETVIDFVDGQVKKPPVPSKKSPTPAIGVGGLFSGLKSKMLSSSSSDKEKSSTVSSSASNSSGEWDKPDGGAPSKPAGAKENNTGTFDHVERNSILNDPRAQRVKAPRRRPPSQALRDDAAPLAPAGQPPAPHTPPLSNGHDALQLDADKPTPPEKAEEIKPKAREWEKHRAPWMEELKLNQAKKTSLGDGKKSNSGSTDRLLECGLEEKRSTHSMEMSKSTSSISNRISVLESFEEQQTTKVRHSLESGGAGGGGGGAPERDEVAAPRTVSMHSPTAAGRTFTTMLDEVKKPPAPSPPTPAPAPHSAAAPPAASARTDIDTDRHAKLTTAKFIEYHSTIDNITNEKERKFSVEEKVEKIKNGDRSSLERRSGDALVAQLNNRITNLEKLLEVQNAKFTAAIEDLTRRLAMETDRRLALQAEVDKLAHCVTSV